MKISWDDLPTISNLMAESSAAAAAVSWALLRGRSFRCQCVGRSLTSLVCCRGGKGGHLTHCRLLHRNSECLPPNGVPFHPDRVDCLRSGGGHCETRCKPLVRGIGETVAKVLEGSNCEPGSRPGYFVCVGVGKNGEGAPRAATAGGPDQTRQRPRSSVHHDLARVSESGQSAPRVSHESCGCDVFLRGMCVAVGGGGNDPGAAIVADCSGQWLQGQFQCVGAMQGEKLFEGSSCFC